MNFFQNNKRYMVCKQCNNAIQTIVYAVQMTVYAVSVSIRSSFTFICGTFFCMMMVLSGISYTYKCTAYNTIQFYDSNRSVKINTGLKWHMTGPYIERRKSCDNIHIQLEQTNLNACFMNPNRYVCHAS